MNLLTIEPIPEWICTGDLIFKYNRDSFFIFLCSDGSLLEPIHQSLSTILYDRVYNYNHRNLLRKAWDVVNPLG